MPSTNEHRPSSSQRYAADDHPWRLVGVTPCETAAAAILQVFKYNPTPTLAQLAAAGGAADAAYNMAIAQLLEDEVIEVCARHPTRYRLTEE
jgi:hypothetical protein